MTGLNERRRRKRVDAAQGYLFLNLPELALNELQTVDPAGDFDLLMLVAECHRQRLDFAASLGLFEQAAELRANDVAALMGQAWCQKRLGRLDRSIECMLQARRAHPQEPILTYNLSCYYSLDGQKEQALAELARALRMEPKLRRLVPEETDFDAIRQEAKFQLLMQLTRPDSSESEHESESPES